MDIKTILKEKFPEVREAFFEKEMNTNFLRVEASLHGMDEIIELSRKISDFLDTIEIAYSEYYLDVYSAGTETKIAIENLADHLDQNVLIKLKTKIKTYEQFEGILLEVNASDILVKWNARGQMRKQIIALENIESAQLSTKF